MCGLSKINYAENTASIYRYVIWKERTESSVKTVPGIVDHLVFTPDAPEKVLWLYCKKSTANIPEGIWWDNCLALRC